MEPVPVTGRLTLRRFTPDDVDGLLALDGDPAVMRYLDSRIKSRAEIETEVLPRVLDYYVRYRGALRRGHPRRRGVHRMVRDAAGHSLRRVDRALGRRAGARPRRFAGLPAAARDTPAPCTSPSTSRSRATSTATSSTGCAAPTGGRARGAGGAL